eukprot:365766-Chlamydomonas_euryale.AAC.9
MDACGNYRRALLSSLSLLCNVGRPCGWNPPPVSRPRSGGLRERRRLRFGGSMHAMSCHHLRSN